MKHIKKLISLFLLVLTVVSLYYSDNISNSMPHDSNTHIAVIEETSIIKF